MANGESSKKGKKKRKQEQAAIVAALAQAERATQGVCIRELGEEVATNSIQSSRNDETNKGKQKTGRGPAKFKLNETNKELETNEFYEPVGPNSSEYAGDLGILVREHVPSSIKSWKDVPVHIKDNMWGILKRKWKLTEADKKMALQKMGKIRRDSKSKVSKKIREFDANDIESEGEYGINDLRPSWMDADDWEVFLQQRQSKEFKNKSLKYQEIRKKQTFVHTSSRKGFARLEYELKKNAEDASKITRVDLWTKGYTKDGKSNNPDVLRALQQIESFSNTPEGQSEKSINNDALAHVFGAERPGRVRGLGFGATPSKVRASIGGKRANKAIMDELSTSKERVGRMDALEQQLNQQTAQMNQMQEMIASLVSQISQSQGAQPHAIQVTVGQTQQSGPRVPLSSNLENAKCTLLNWMVEREVAVGEGYILSTNPNSLCHSVPLGPSCYKVWVAQVFNNIHLFRSSSEHHFLSDAFRSAIPWPIQYLKIHE